MKSTGARSSNELQTLDYTIGYQDSGLNNGCQQHAPLSLMKVFCNHIDDDYIQIFFFTEPGQIRWRSLLQMSAVQQQRQVSEGDVAFWHLHPRPVSTNWWCVWLWGESPMSAVPKKATHSPIREKQLGSDGWYEVRGLFHKQRSAKLALSLRRG